MPTACPPERSESGVIGRAVAHHILDGVTRLLLDSRQLLPWDFFLFARDPVTIVNVIRRIIPLPDYTTKGFCYAPTMASRT